MGIQGRDGAFAELVCVPERNCHVVPDQVSDEQAVFVEPLAAAIQVVEVQPVDRWMDVVVIGSGRLGLLVAQVLKLHGCRPKWSGVIRTSHLRTCGIQPIERRNSSPGYADVVVECTGSPED